MTCEAMHLIMAKNALNSNWRPHHAPCYTHHTGISGQLFMAISPGRQARCFCSRPR